MRDKHDDVRSGIGPLGLGATSSAVGSMSMGMVVASTISVSILLLLFLVLALDILRPQPGPLRTFELDPAKLERSLADLRGQGLAAIVTDYGRAAPETRAATVEVYASSRSDGGTGGAFDRLLLTLVAMLAAGAVGFCLGGASGSMWLGGASASTPAALLDLERKRLKEQLGLLDTEIRKVGKAVGDLKTSAGPGGPRRDEALARAEQSQIVVEELREQARRDLEAADTRISASGGIRGIRGRKARAQSHEEAQDHLVRSRYRITELERAQASQAELVSSIFLLR